MVPRLLLLTLTFASCSHLGASLEDDEDGNPRPELDTSFPRNIPHVEFEENCQGRGSEGAPLTEAETVSLETAVGDLLSTVKRMEIPVRTIYRARRAGLPVLQRIKMFESERTFGVDETRKAYDDYISLDVTLVNLKYLCLNKSTKNPVVFVLVILRWEINGEYSREKWPNEGTRYDFEFGIPFDKRFGNPFFIQTGMSMT